MPDRRRGVLAAYAVLATWLLVGCGTVPTGAPRSSPTPGPATVSATPTPTPSPSATTSSPAAPTSSTPSPTASTPASTPATATLYAERVQLRGDRLSWRELRWFTGKAARARCRKLGVKSAGALCYEYYYEKTSRTGTGTLATDADVRLLDDDGAPERGSVAELAPALAADTWPYYRIRRSGDTITAIEQVFTP